MTAHHVPGIQVGTLTALGLSKKGAELLASEITYLQKHHTPHEVWQLCIQEILTKSQSFDLHRYVYQCVYQSWQEADKGPPPMWIPQHIHRTQIYELMNELGLEDYPALYRFSINEKERFWALMLKKLQIQFKQPYDRIAGDIRNVQHPNWLKDSKLNIVDSCFLAPKEAVAIRYQNETGEIEAMSYQMLEYLTNRVANGLTALDLGPGDAIAIDMPLTPECVAAYLGIIKMGGHVISIADSFASNEIGTRLRIGNAKAIFTQDAILRGGKPLPLYTKVKEAKSPLAIVCSESMSGLCEPLREGDLAWQDFLSDRTSFESHSCDPYDATNILFSSGTTGNPKAIPWTHLTPIKCASDAYLHHNIHDCDVLAWPTNIGWMMGPWLIYAGLINRGTLALYDGLPTTKTFGEFVQNTGVTMLGVVPSLVKAWRESDCMEGLNWSQLDVFSSTGECSNAEDYHYLMYLGGYKPIIEYCGGTEIGGGYITGTCVQPASPAVFTTPALGLAFKVLDESGKPSPNGEVFIEGPSLGLSESLLNQDHDDVYYKDTPMPTLRRHGDQIQCLSGGMYRAQGRADDTMNLGGIKVSSAEIERVLNTVEHVHETAAISVSPEAGGPSELVVYVVADAAIDSSDLMSQLQRALKTKLNPLFKIKSFKFVQNLPRTASNKVMRRVLRADYQKNNS